MKSVASSWEAKRFVLRQHGFMQEFSSSLVREKIVFIDGGKDIDPLADEGEASGPTIIRSNRIFLRLSQGTKTEKIVIRGQNMHGTLRMAAKVYAQFRKGGPFTERASPFDWQDHWDQLVSAYDKEFNPGNWIGVYINGKPVFKTLTSPFVDVVEQCALLTLENYDGTMGVAEHVLKEVGKAVRIQHFTNVAAVFSEEERNGIRCGIVHRSDVRDTTFNFSVIGGERDNRIIQALSTTAAFLEMFNLTFVIRSARMRLKAKEIDFSSPESKQARAAEARQGTLSRQINSFEEVFTVKYRPEKPDLMGGL